MEAAHPELATERVEHLFNVCNFSGTGQIEYAEFVAATLASQKQCATGNSILAAFNTLDVDHDGFISLSDLHEAFSGQLEDDLAESLLTHRDESGRVDFESFKRSILGLLAETNGEVKNSHSRAQSVIATLVGNTKFGKETHHFKDTVLTHDKDIHPAAAPEASMVRAVS